MRIKSILLALLISVSATAQISEAKKDSIEKYGVKYRSELGYGQDFRYGKAAVTSPYHVIKAGVNVEYPLVHGFGLETGLRYGVGFGNRYQRYAHSDTATFKYVRHELDIPLRANYTLPIIWGIKAFAYAGPLINIGLTHKDNVSFTAKEPDPAPTNPLAYPEPGVYDIYKTDLRRINLQLGAGGGVQWQNYRIKSGYEWGINSISRKKEYPERVKGWYVAFEYQF